MRSWNSALMIVFLFAPPFGTASADPAPVGQLSEPNAPQASSDAIHYLTIPASAFHPESEDYDYEIHGRYLIHFGQAGQNSSGAYYASLNLPQGAHIEKVTYFWKDPGPPGSTSAVIERSLRWTDNMEMVAGVPTSYDVFAPSFESLSSTANHFNIDQPINNFAYNYYVRIDISGGGQTWGCAFQIEYTEPAGDSTPIAISIPSVAFTPYIDEKAERANAPVTDLVADAIEITQSMQDLNNSVPLVEGKRTFVRVYAHSTNNIYPTTAILKLESGALTQTLLPIAPGGPQINVRPSYNRLIPSHAFLFELPMWATFVDNLTLTTTVNPSLRWRAQNPEEFNYANNTLVTTASFDFVPKLHLVIADQPYTLNNITYTSRPYDHWKSAEWLTRVYPLSQVKVYFRTLPAVQASRILDKNQQWDLTIPNCNWLNLYLAVNRYAIFGNPFLPQDAAFLGIVSDEMGFMRGCAQRGGMITAKGFARTASGPVGDSDWGWDFDGSYADWYSAHEVGHAFGRPHVRGGPGFVEGGCGGEAKAVIHNPNGSISPTSNIFDPAAIFGFDSSHLVQGLNPILGPTWSDVMTYCDYQWMSKTTYVKLKETFEAALPLEAAPAPQKTTGQNVAQPALAVFGALDLQSGELAMLPISVLSSETEITPPAPGPYSIILYDADVNELARYPFSPHGLYNGAEPNAGAENEAAYISELVPYDAGAASLEIKGPAGVLFQVAAGLSLPAVQVTAPNGGEVFGEESITVSWTASDEDGDPLTFNIDYSADNGNSWEPVALFITDTQVTVDPINLPASDMGLFRVSVSDGLHSASDSSDGIFFISNHLPTGEILLPAADTTIALDQTITFQGQVYDNDLGMLDEGSLQWWSDRDGLLGTGATFSTASLSLGLHEINLVADDGQGEYVIDQVIVTVVSTPNDLSPQSDALVVGPDLTFLYPNDGISSGTIYLDNLNLGSSLAWSVSSSEDWIELSASSGVTPQEISVSTTLSAWDFGTHKALLTFSDPDGVYAMVYTVVVVTNPENKLFLPVMVR